ncbi:MULTISPECIES: hypothetical protein [unclassified Streptomyces]|uniref:hypothetical protein n=1 Tax=unclassified Streptomyces TaxID=2593676 RepID=UPI000F6F760E|nr:MULTISPECIES: hypothetical protein [unclassified Streptomyces]AZM60124.1 hypothetical protein DLM49_11645 [Streptomyces sp. WAC 01438]RSM99886.1 hypothetical protein DMA10_06650 [Streptomyces sp. WAC 01420]
MTPWLHGTGARIDFDGPWLVFSWWRRRSEPVSAHGGRLYLPPEWCVSVRGRLSAGDGGLRLAFRFRPGGATRGADVVAEIVVDADRAAAAWRSAEWFAREYRVADLSASWQDTEPAAAEREEAGDWLSAPVPPTTQALFRSVMARLTAADV